MLRRRWQRARAPPGTSEQPAVNKQHTARSAHMQKPACQQHAFTVHFSKHAFIHSKLHYRFRKERDFHRMHHKRVVQEKNRLIIDIKRLKVRRQLRQHLLQFGRPAARMEPLAKQPPSAPVSAQADTLP